MITNLLTKLEEEKDQWIYEAIDYYTHGFLRFDGQKYEKDQVLIGLYGPAQAEKTTLILTLLGIGDEHIRPLSLVIQRKAALITSFLYKRSKDQNFYLIFPDKTIMCCADLEELETALESVRKQMDAGNVSYDKPFILQIARQFFTHKRFADKSELLSFIDLPGDDSKEKRFEEYADPILTTYLPLCSIILVVGNSSNQMDRLAVGDWMDDHENFRFVLTQCLQPASVKSRIESAEIASLEEFRSYYQDHLNGSDTENIFPLDFGDTWLELKEIKSPVYQKAKGWIDQLFIALLDELTAAQTPENQIIQIINFEHSIRRQRKLDLEKIGKGIQLLEESLQEDQQYTENLVTASQSLQTEIEIYETELMNLDQIELEEFTCNLSEKFTFDDNKDQVVFKERKRSKLIQSFQMAEKEMLDFYKAQITKSSLTLQQIIQRITPSVRIDFQMDPVTKGLYLNHRRGLDQYLKRGNFGDDYSIVLDTLERNNTIVYNYYFSQLNHFKQNGKKDLMQLWDTKKEHLRLAAEKLNEKQEQQKQKEASILVLQEKLDRVKQQDMEPPLQLDEILKEEFVKVAAGWQEKLFSDHVTDADRWVYHQYCQMIVMQAERIIRNDDF